MKRPDNRFRRDLRRRKVFAIYKYVKVATVTMHLWECERDVVIGMIVSSLDRELVARDLFRIGEPVVNAHQLPDDEPRNTITVTITGRYAAAARPVEEEK